MDVSEDWIRKSMQTHYEISKGDFVVVSREKYGSCMHEVI